MDFAPAVAMAVLVMKVVDFLRYARNRDLNGVLTQASAWVAGVIAVTLAAHTNWAKALPIGDMRLSELNLAAQVFVGLFAGSTGSLLTDFRKAVDNTTSSAVPTLLDTTPAAPPVARKATLAAPTKAGAKRVAKKTGAARA